MTTALTQCSALTRAKYGDAANRSDTRSPTLEADGSLHLGPEDGEVFASVRARYIEEQAVTIRADMNELRAMLALTQPDVQFRYFGLRLTLTVARFIWEMDQVDAPGTKTIGHLRYPWISAVGYRPKQSLLKDPTILLKYTQPFSKDPDSCRVFTMAFGFDKAFNPGPMAHALVQAIARHNLAHGAPDEARPAFERLAVAPPLPDPAKNEFAEYFLPAAQFPNNGGWHITDAAADR